MFWRLPEVLVSLCLFFPKSLGGKEKLQKALSICFLTKFALNRISKSIKQSLLLLSLIPACYWILRLFECSSEIPGILQLVFCAVVLLPAGSGQVPGMQLATCTSWMVGVV